MSIRTPKVAVGLPVYNGEVYLETSVEALLGQTFGDFELILLDNASTDATEAICRRYARLDTRVRYVRNKRNIGSVPNFNKVFRLTNSPYFKWAAHDDVPLPTYLEYCVAALDAAPDAAMAHSHIHLIDDEGALIPYDAELEAFVNRDGYLWSWAPERCRAVEDADPIERFVALLYSRCAEWIVYGVHRTRWLRQTRLFLLQGEEDVLMTEMLLQGRVATVEEPLFLHRLHAGSARYMTRRECLAYQTGEWPGATRLPTWERSINFVRAVLSAPLTPQQKMRGLAVLLRYALRTQSLKNAVLPGPNNYWGLGSSKAESTPAEATPRRRPAPSQDPAAVAL